MKTRFHRLTGGFLGGLLCLLLTLLGSSPVIAEKSVTVTFYHTDVLGSVIATSDEFGHLQWRRDYQPYGEIQLPRDSNDTDTTTNSLGYTGKPRDPNGLVYLGARYYDPLAGRFMAVDPAGIDAGNPHSFNRYAYAHNNPYKYVDPDGRLAFIAVLAISIGLEALNVALEGLYDQANPCGDCVRSSGVGIPGPPAAASRLSTATATKTAASLSDLQFLQRVATKAESTGVRLGKGASGTGSGQGIWKHDYSKKVVDRYQQVTGQKTHLELENSWLGGQPVKYGTSGSARPDVFDPLTGTIYDYKFIRNPGQGLSAAQRAKNSANVPNVTNQIEINP